MEFKNFSFSEAMNIVGNGGNVSRPSFGKNLYISMDCEDMLCTYETFGGESEELEYYTPNIDDIKAQDWYLYKISEIDYRTDEEVDFDECLLNIVEELRCMMELDDICLIRGGLRNELLQLLDLYSLNIEVLEEHSEEIMDMLHGSEEVEYDEDDEDFKYESMFPFSLLDVEDEECDYEEEVEEDNPLDFLKEYRERGNNLNQEAKFIARLLSESLK